jgi:thiol-disulfide isomerase/thioredoxin
MAGAVATSLPFIELAIVLGLLFESSARAAAISGFAVTSAFTVLLAVNLRKGKRPNCNCFGTLSQAPISGRSIVRNLVLIAGFVVVVFGPKAPGVGTAVADYALSHETPRTVVVVLLATIGVEGLAVVHFLLRRPSQVMPFIEGAFGLPIGTRAPAFVLPDLAGADTNLASLLRADRPLLLAFIDPDCEPCGALLPELADWQSTYGDVLSIALVSSGSVEENQRKVAEFELAPVLLQGGDEVAAAYAALATPSAVLIFPSGRVGSTAAGAHAIRHLVEGAVAGLEAGDGVGMTPAVGAEAPLIAIENVNGEEQQLSLLALRGRLVLLVFWSPTCEFCRALLPRLREWEQMQTEDGPSLFVVSHGPVEANRAVGFSMIGVDNGSLTRRAYGIRGTPSAVLVDASGRVASPVVAGADATMGLASRATALTSAARRIQGLTTPQIVPAEWS